MVIFATVLFGKSHSHENEYSSAIYFSLQTCMDISKKTLNDIHSMIMKSTWQNTAQKIKANTLQKLGYKEVLVYQILLIIITLEFGPH